MNLNDLVMQAAGGQIVGQLAKNFGIDDGQAQSAVQSLLPALSRGLQKNAGQGDGLSSLLGALQGGGHARYADDAASLTRDDAVSDGNAILGHILGSKDASRNVASHAAAQTGLSADLLKKMLPMVAAVAMGSLSKQTASGGALAGATGGAGSSGDMLGALSGLLDADKDGSALDDVLGLAKKFF